jgi:hypothetical protein
MFEASGSGGQSPKKASKSEQLLKVEDSLRFLEDSFHKAEDTGTSSILRLIADRVADVQEDIEDEERQKERA